MLDLLFPEAVFEHDAATDGPGREMLPRASDLLVLDPRTNCLGIIRNGDRCWFRATAGSDRSDAWRLEDSVSEPDLVALHVARQYSLDAVPQPANDAGEHVWRFVAHKT